MNRPFKGGYVVRKHGALGFIPWIQVELNRSLYLPPGPLTATPGEETLRRLADLRRRFTEALEELFPAERR